MSGPIGGGYSSHDGGQKPGLGNVSSGVLAPQLPSVDIKWSQEIKDYHKTMEVFITQLLDYIRRLQMEIISATSVSGGEVDCIVGIRYNRITHKLEYKHTLALVPRINEISDWLPWAGGQPIVLPAVDGTPSYTNVWVFQADNDEDGEGGIGSGGAGPFCVAGYDPAVLPAIACSNESGNLRVPLEDAGMTGSATTRTYGPVVNIIVDVPAHVDITGAYNCADLDSYYVGRSSADPDNYYEVTITPVSSFVDGDPVLTHYLLQVLYHVTGTGETIVWQGIKTTTGIAGVYTRLCAVYPGGRTDMNDAYPAILQLTVTTL